MKFISILITFSLIMLVLSSPLPKENDDGKDGNVSKSDSEKASKSDSEKVSKSDSKKVSKSDAGDDDSSDSDKSSKSNQKDAKDSKDSKDSSSAQASSGDGDKGGAASVLSSQAYNDFQISDGVAGDAEQKAAAIFKDIDQNNLASVSDADLKRIKAVHDVAEDAEVKQFNPAIEKATGAEAEALEAGKIQNKVLKTTATVLQLETEIAQGKDVDPAKLEKEKKKKAKNIEIDNQNKGKTSKGVKSDGST